MAASWAAIPVFWAQSQASNQSGSGLHHRDCGKGPLQSVNLDWPEI